MLKHKVHRIPIVDNDAKVVGIVSCSLASGLKTVLLCLLWSTMLSGGIYLLPSCQAKR